MTRRRIPFVSLTPGEDSHSVREAIERVIERGWFVLGPEVEQFEVQFAAAAGASHAIGVGNGTDALALILRALGIGPGDEVITTSLSAAYTALAISMTGATPVFADVDPVRLTIDPDSIAAVVRPRTRAILPVHLYGQAADMLPIERLASRHNLAIVEDCCQAHLATANGRPVGTIGHAGAFSFIQRRISARWAMAAAVITNDRSLAEKVKRLRNGGRSTGTIIRNEESILDWMTSKRPSWERSFLASRLDRTTSSARRQLPGSARGICRRCTPRVRYRSRLSLVRD